MNARKISGALIEPVIGLGYLRYGAKAAS